MTAYIVKPGLNEFPSLFDVLCHFICSKILKFKRCYGQTIYEYYKIRSSC